MNTQKGFSKIYIIIAILGIIALAWFYIIPTWDEMSFQKKRADSYREYVADNLSEEEVLAENRENEVVKTSNMDSWQECVNSLANFSIDCPKYASGFAMEYMNGDWVHTVGEISSFYGTPLSKSGGYIWGVSKYDLRTHPLEDLIKASGSQFEEKRKENRENIKVGEKDALLVTVTTESKSDWISKSVYIKDGDFVYVIGNGAVDVPEFSRFYKSFKILPKQTVSNLKDIELFYTPQTYKIGDTVTLKYKLSDFYKDYDVLVDLKNSQEYYGYGNRKAGLLLNKIDDETVSFVLEDVPSEDVEMKKGIYDLCVWISIKGSAEDCIKDAVKIE